MSLKRQPSMSLFASRAKSAWIFRKDQLVKQRANTTVSDKMTRIVVLGSSEVGKTTIVRQFLNHRFLEQHVSTSSDLYYLHTEENVSMEILDTGDFLLPSLRKMTIKTGHAFILVYSLDNQRSFESVRAFKDEIQAVHGNRVPIVVVGNKADQSRSVSLHPVVTDCVVTIDWECRHFEVSAKEYMNVEQIFEDVIKQLAYRRQKRITKTTEMLGRSQSQTCI